LSFVPFPDRQAAADHADLPRPVPRRSASTAARVSGVRDITLLFTDLKESTALYDRIGDLNAFALVQQHFDRLQDVTVRNNGAGHQDDSAMR
jgi:class 3 adenylate cyclase